MREDHEYIVYVYQRSHKKHSPGLCIGLGMSTTLKAEVRLQATSARRERIKNVFITDNKFSEWSGVV
jgi:hypothetical protein